jgi:hypothetical protein
MLGPDELKAAAAKSNAVITELGPGIKWINSVIVKDRTFCHYQAESEEIIRDHARISGFPANAITEIAGGLSPQTGSI